MKGDPRYDLPLPVRLSDDAEVTPSEASNGEERFYFLRLAASGEIFEFGEGEYFIISHLNAASPLRSIQEALNAKYQIVCSLQGLEAFVAELLEMGVLVETARSAEGNAREESRSAPNESASAFEFAPEVALGRGAERSTTRLKDPMRGPFRWPLFDPTRLFRMLGYAFSPFRYATWLLMPGVLMAGLILFHRQLDLIVDFRALMETTSGLPVNLPIFILSLFAVNLTSRLTQGTVAQRHGANVRYFGLQLFLGIFPRFYVDREGFKSLSRRGQLWAHGAPLVARLWLFVFGTFVWVTYRQTGTWLSDVGLMIGQAGLFAFVFTAIPLVPIDGYHWLATYLDQPHMRLRGFRLIGMWLRGRPAPETLGGGAKFALASFTIASVLYTLLLLSLLYLYLGAVLEGEYRGTGVALFLGIFALSVLWFISMRIAMRKRRARPARQQGRQRPAMEGLESGAVIPFQTALPARAKGMALGWPSQPERLAPIPRRRKSFLPKIFWLSALAVGLYVAFLPYPYEVGGDFEVLPTQRTQAISRADGEIMEVLVKEGDWVKAGDLLAKLSDWDEKRDLAIVQAELEKAQAHLRRLEAGPKPEEVELAQKQVEAARERVTFNKAEMERANELGKDKIIAERKVEHATSQYRTAMADLKVALANLELTRSGAIQPDIDAAEAEVKRLQTELAYRKDELERTRIVAPTSGQIVTSNPDLMIGRYLQRGQVLAEIEDNRMALVEVSVPESDIAYVDIGDRVRLKAWAYSDSETLGTVISLAPAADTKGYGRVVRVKTLVPNADGAIRSEMTGYAKIDGAELPVWKAFSHMIMRFFRIEVWSWIP